ncbi:MAG: hypothetical protein Q8M16_07990 [Pirellulaceae bacterium]|nr:hypothetical protein [Pirellulaceae bacterium]
MSRNESANSSSKIGIGMWMPTIPSTFLIALQISWAEDKVDSEHPNEMTTTAPSFDQWSSCLTKFFILSRFHSTERNSTEYTGRLTQKSFPDELSYCNLRSLPSSSRTTVVALAPNTPKVLPSGKKLGDTQSFVCRWGILVMMGGSVTEFGFVEVRVAQFLR